MKTFTYTLLAIIIQSSLTLSCLAQEKSGTVWKEKDEFHKIMAATFHPAEDGNFKPIRERANELVDKAVAWKKSVAPKEFSSAEISKKLDELVKGANQIAASVKDKANDAEVKKQLTELHEVFHNIIGLCEHEKEK